MAVATPCWPAPVSAITRGLPIRARQQRLAERVVDLVRAGVEQVLALEVDRRRRPPPRGASRAVERGRAGRRSRAAAASSSVAEGRVGARRQPLALELVERRDQRLRARSGRRRGRSAARSAARSRERLAAGVGRLAPRGRTPSAWPGPCARARPRCRSRCRPRTAARPRSPRRRCPASGRRRAPPAASPRWRRGELPVEASRPCRPACRGDVGVEQVEVGVEALQVGELRARRGRAPPSSPARPCAAPPRGSRPGPRRRAAAASSGCSGPPRPRPRRASRSRTPRPARRRRCSSPPISSAASSGQARGLPRPEDHAERPGAEVGGPAGVLEVGDAADLDPGHARNARRHAPRRTAYGSWPARRCCALVCSRLLGRLPA